jgi:hypothetical protein
MCNVQLLGNRLPSYFDEAKLSPELAVHPLIKLNEIGCI